MMKYTKRISALFCAVMLILCTSVCVFAQASGVITDNATLFSDSEKAELQSQLDALSEKTGWMAVIYTNYDGYDADNIKPHTNRYYADNYGKTTAGVMLTIDMEGRAVDFRTKGDATVLSAIRQSIMTTVFPRASRTKTLIFRKKRTTLCFMC